MNPSSKIKTVFGGCDAQRLALILPYKSGPTWLRANGFHKALETLKDPLATNQLVYHSLLSSDSASLKLH